MKASDIISASIVCQQAARNIYPQDPSELFNTCWLIIREKEIKQPEWKPDNPKNYFLRMMKNKVIDWKKEAHTINIEEINETTIEQTEINTQTPCKAFILEWVSERVKDEDLLCLKNILTLALFSRTKTEAIENSEISRKQFYTLLTAAKKQLYDDYHNANNNNIRRNTLV